jgi:hypothetical protein
MWYCAQLTGYFLHALCARFYVRSAVLQLLGAVHSDTNYAMMPCMISSSCFSDCLFKVTLSLLRLANAVCAKVPAGGLACLVSLQHQPCCSAVKAGNSWHTYYIDCLQQ